MDDHRRNTSLKIILSGNIFGEFFFNALFWFKASLDGVADCEGQRPGRRLFVFFKDNWKVGFDWWSLKLKNSKR